MAQAVARLGPKVEAGVGEPPRLQHPNAQRHLLRVLGADPARPTPAWRARIGVQLQSAALPPKIKVGEAVDLFASFYDSPLDGGTLLAELGIAAKKNSYVDKLSSNRL